MMAALGTYLVAVNIIAMLLFGIDKGRAKRKAWRIPERILILSAVAGGSVGALAGMLAFRHKTKHKKFTIAVPLALVSHLAILSFFAVRYGVF